MQWIKHSTFFARQAFMIEIAHETGNSGCYAVWLLLERAGEVWNGEGQPQLRLPFREWQITAQLPTKKLQRVLAILEEHGIVRTEYENEKLTVYADILLKLMDEGTRKRRNSTGEPPEKIQSPAGLRTDTDKDQERRKEQNTGKAFPEKGKREALAFLRRQGIAPESPYAEAWLAYLEKQQPHNPVGYIKHILKTNPDFDPRGEDAAPEGARTKECLDTATILQRMRFPGPGSTP